MYQRGLWTLAAAWMLAVAAGFLAILKYGSTPGHAGTPAVHWPRETHVLPDPDRANLVLVVHPQCPCTRASIDSLARIMTRCQGELSAHVLCYRPAGFPRDWEKTDLWHNAAIIPGVQVLSDEDGAEAERFGAEASGHALLYGLGGRLLFSGGITIARGHAGPNPGESAVIALLTRGTADLEHWHVFGCPLNHPLPPESEGQPCER